MMRFAFVAVMVLWVSACGEVPRSIIDAPLADCTTCAVDAAVDAAVAGCDTAQCNIAMTDGCCPAACNANNDRDCSVTCGNNVVEIGETCDPQSTCPTACPQDGCTLRTLSHAGTCQAECVDNGAQTQCVLGVDGCCPAGCTAANDTDCAAVCGNGSIEAGETCDPLATCPTACPQQGCQLFALSQAGTCRADCLPSGLQTACVNGDGCCPGGCNANTDSDCAPTCGNAVIESGETCDPLASCPSVCEQVGCTLRSLANPASCTAACVDSGTQTACANGDQCCPSGCNATNDSDCAPGCGNGVIEAGETCDPVETCPTSCRSIGCSLYTLQGSDCTAECVQTGTQTVCQNGDGCCPAGCNANSDSDCTPTCGNDVIETGETCDPPGSCSCGTEAFTCYQTTGAAATCDLKCHQPIQTCGLQDSCCAYDGSSGCSSSTDLDCAGPRWAYTPWPGGISYTTASCTTISVYGIQPSASYVFTTCVPPGIGVGSGDSVISSITDNNGRSYNVTNDDCGDPTAMINLAGWDCRNNAGVLRMSCASPSPGGFMVGPLGVSRLDVKVCPYAGNQFGSAPLYIWFNANTVPHPG
jgi:hypothetical protein